MSAADHISYAEKAFASEAGIFKKKAGMGIVAITLFVASLIAIGLNASFLGRAFHMSPQAAGDIMAALSGIVIGVVTKIAVAKVDREPVCPQPVCPQPRGEQNPKTLSVLDPKRYLENRLEVKLNLRPQCPEGYGREES